MKERKRTRKEWLESRINHVEMTPNLNEVLTGILLSDGYINHQKGRNTASLRVMQSQKRRGWLLQIRQQLEVCGLVVRMDTTKRPPSPIGGRMLPGGEYDLLRTLNYWELVEVRHQWYPGGQKIVPKDIRLTPLTLNHWFCGDGRGGDRKGTLGFSTDGFSFEDVDFLVERLSQDLNIQVLRVTSHRGQPQILVSQRDEAVKVKTLLAPHIPECCQYKLKHVRPLQKTGRGRRLSEELKHTIKQEHGTCTMREAARRHGVAVSKVWTLWHESS